MTFVGKILVIVLMVFSLFFLALSTVVFTTNVNWKAEVSKLGETKKNLEDQLRRAKAAADDQRTLVDAAKSDAKKAETDFRNQIKNISDERARYSDEITKQRAAVEVAIRESRSSQEEAEARTAETNKLREILKSVQEQATQFKLQQTELQQQIMILKREVDVAKTINADLRNRVAVLQASLRKNGLESNPTTLVVLASPPDGLEGEVLKVDKKNAKLIEISIGSNDGLKPGHELDLYRLKPLAKYLGKVRIVETDPNQSSARVVGETVHGIKIQEGDSVTTQIRPRS